jgi:hypothetical protein
MANKTPEQIVEKYSRGVQAGAQDYASGVQNPSRSWSQATAAGARRWAAGVQNAIQNRSFERGVQAAGDQKWVSRASTIGAQRYSAAAQEAAAAYSQVAGQIMAAGQAAKAAAASVDRSTQEGRYQAALSSMRATSSYWQNRKRGA